ncbi:MAG: hypothetical protein R3A45_08825 [Bdellovibrionota bacterium]
MKSVAFLLFFFLSVPYLYAESPRCRKSAPNQIYPEKKSLGETVHEIDQEALYYEIVVFNNEDLKKAESFFQENKVHPSCGSVVLKDKADDSLKHLQVSENGKIMILFPYKENCKRLEPDTQYVVDHEKYEIRTTLATVLNHEKIYFIVVYNSQYPYQKKFALEYIENNNSNKCGIAVPYSDQFEGYENMTVNVDGKVIVFYAR